MAAGASRWETIRLDREVESLKDRLKFFLN